MQSCHKYLRLARNIQDWVHFGGFGRHNKHSSKAKWLIFWYNYWFMLRAKHSSLTLGLTAFSLVGYLLKPSRQHNWNSNNHGTEHNENVGKLTSTPNCYRCCMLTSVSIRPPSRRGDYYSLRRGHDNYFGRPANPYRCMIFLGCVNYLLLVKTNT